MMRTTSKNGSGNCICAIYRSLQVPVQQLPLVRPRVPAYPFQVGPQIRGALIPQTAILFQSPLDDSVEFLGKIGTELARRDRGAIQNGFENNASWMCITVYEWLSHFHKMCTFLMLSRKEELVDKKGDPKSLFWKIDFLHDRQPRWLRAPCERMKMHCANVDTGSTIDGESRP